MKISIIIVTYNSINLIKDCLNSIFKYNDIGNELEVIIADNASSNQTAMFDLIKTTFGTYNVKMFDTGENGGYGKGNNFGFSKTDSDIIIVMNPDVRLVAPIFKKILNEFEDSTLGMAGVEFIDGSSPYYFKPEHDSLLHSLLIYAYIKRRKYDARKMYLSGSLMIFDRNTFISSGKYDENIFMYYEEADITNRILNIGKNVKWLKGVMVEHLAHNRKFNKKLNDISNNSFEYYCSKYGIDVLKHYSIAKRVLQLKLAMSKLIMDFPRIDLLTKKIESINKRIELLSQQTNV